MNRWIKVLFGIVALAAAVLFATVMVAGGRWRGDTEGIILQLRAAAPETAAPFDPAEITDLPDPVRRYFETALTPGQPVVRGARLRQTGQFRIAPGEDGWRPFEAVEYFTPSPPAFVWDARITTAPLLDVRVRDRYAEGQGGILARLAGLLTVAEAAPGPELAAGALQRYLAEAVWLPTALLPRFGVRWTPVDDRRARATIGDAGVEVSLEFRFSDDYDVVGIHADARFREQDGSYVPTPWSGTFSDHEVRGGMRIPLAGEVVWHLPEGEEAYWRGRIERIDYELFR